ncbi:MAG: hypothetical protein HOO91_03805 [Bacteroidales bacterium]|nr:hypothetical protein [Bacteroidales bacterium]
MKLPSESSSSEVLVNYSVYTSVRVDVKHETNQLSAPIVDAYEALETKITERKKKTKESAAKLAMRDEKNDCCDSAVVNLSLELLSATGNNREDIRYKSLFTKTPSRITVQPIKDKSSDVKVLIQKLSTNSGDAIYAKHLSLIQAAVAELDEAEASYQTALVNEQSSYDFERASQAALRSTLVRTYGKLIDIAGKKNADNYFKKSADKKKKEKKQGEKPIEP